MKIPYDKIERGWSLFLDRDGVINHEKHQDYIHTWDEFQFYNGVLDAMKLLSEVFHPIVIITNQRGIGKGVTRQQDVEIIHQNMTREIQQHGGRLDAIFYCPDLDDSSPNRKPNPGMGYEAVKKFPEIDLKKTIMVGNTISDMKFGRTLGTYTVFLPTTRPEVDITDDQIDDSFNSLIEFAQYVNRNSSFR